MKSFWNNYKSSIVLLGAILLGGIVGATMGEKAVVLKPIGELFLNLLFMTLVPLVFFSVTSAIANMGGDAEIRKDTKEYSYSIFRNGFSCCCYRISWSTFNESNKRIRYIII